MKEWFHENLKGHAETTEQQIRAELAELKLTEEEMSQEM